MVLSREYIDWNTFFSDEVTMPHGFQNMHENPDNGLEIDPPPP